MGNCFETEYTTEEKQIRDQFEKEEELKRNKQRLEFTLIILKTFNLEQVCREIKYHDKFLIDIPDRIILCFNLKMLRSLGYSQEKANEIYLNILRANKHEFTRLYPSQALIDAERYDTALSIERSAVSMAINDDRVSKIDLLTN
jgi:hypothetical protein